MTIRASQGLEPVQVRRKTIPSRRTGMTPEQARTRPRTRKVNQCSHGAYEIPMTKPSGESTRATV